MLQVKTPALVLDKQPGYNDEGNVTLFTKDFGILRLTASGIYRAGASLAAWTEPPTSIVADITLHEKSFSFGRLLTLTLKDYYTHIRSSYENLSWFYFYSFLLMNFLPHGIKSPKTFNLLKEVLEFRESWDDAEKRDLNFAYFLVRLLTMEGICSGFNQCVSCENKFEEGDTVYFTPCEQGLLCKNCSNKTVLGKREQFSNDEISLDFLKLLPQKKALKLPDELLRIRPEERMVLKVCERTEHIGEAYTNIFSSPKINDQTLAKVRNFLLIFLAPVL